MNSDGEKQVCLCVFFSYAFSIIELIMSCDTMAATGYSSNFFHTYFFGFYCYIRGKCDIILKIFHLNSAFFLDFCYIYDFKSQSSVCRSECSVKRSIEMFVPNYFTMLQTNSNDNLYYYFFLPSQTDMTSFHIHGNKNSDVKT